MADLDFDRFRLRRFVERLIEAGEVEVHEEPIALADIAALIEASDKAVLFRDAGPEHFEIIGGVAGSRRRVAIALETSVENTALEYMRRTSLPGRIIEVPPGDAPVQAVVQTGEAIDATSLPFHLQHELDGAPYISSAIDFSIDARTGARNVGCRRLMLCGRRELRANLTQRSDLKRMYLQAAARGEHLPVNFAVGSHPLDLLAASVRRPLDEFALVGALRGGDVPMVKALTNGGLVPADAEVVIEGYFDKAGYTEREGPYGELLGFYGAVHDNPAFRVTAIARRTDALHQTVLHGAPRLARTEAAHLGGLLLEAEIWTRLRAASLDVTAVNGCPGTGGMITARAAVRAATSQAGRTAIAALFEMPFLKHVVVTDETIDIFSDEDVEWAMSARFRPDRDLVLAPEGLGFPMDLTADDCGRVTRIGFDLTQPPGATGIRAKRTRAPQLTRESSARFPTVAAALQDGPRTFRDLMLDLGSRDGREIVRALDALRKDRALARGPCGEWM